MLPGAPLRARAGEGAGSVAEQLGLDQRLGHRRAVDRDERLPRARARWWMARASSSLPVPVSPCSSSGDVAVEHAAGARRSPPASRRRRCPARRARPPARRVGGHGAAAQGVRSALRRPRRFDARPEHAAVVAVHGARRRLRGAGAVATAALQLELQHVARRCARRCAARCRPEHGPARPRLAPTIQPSSRQRQQPFGQRADALRLRVQAQQRTAVRGRAASRTAGARSCAPPSAPGRGCGGGSRGGRRRRRARRARCPPGRRSARRRRSGSRCAPGSARRRAPPPAVPSASAVPMALVPRHCSCQMAPGRSATRSALADELQVAQRLQQHAVRRRPG